MPRTSKRLSLPAPARAFLLDGLEDLARDAGRDRAGDENRIAVTFRPRRRGRDAIPDDLMPLDAFFLVALSRRWSRKARRRRITLSTYEAIIDPLGPGRLAFRPVEVQELTHPGALIHPQPNFTAIRTALILHQALEDAEPGDCVPSPRLPQPYLLVEAARPLAVDLARAGQVEPSGISVDGHRAWPAGLLARRGSARNEDRCPTRAYASLAHLKGRVIRNPAFAVLRRHGLISRGTSYRTWLSTVRRADGRTLQDPGDERTVAGRLRRRIEDDLATNPAREAAILAELAAACTAMGVRLPDDLERVDELASLLDNPWRPATAPYAAAVQVVRSAGRCATSVSSETGGRHFFQSTETTRHRSRRERAGR